MNQLSMASKLRSRDLVPFAFDKPVRYAPVPQDFGRECRHRLPAMERRLLEGAEDVKFDAHADDALTGPVQS